MGSGIVEKSEFGEEEIFCCGVEAGGLGLFGVRGFYEFFDLELEGGGQERNNYVSNFVIIQQRLNVSARKSLCLKLSIFGI
ncbi:MAG: hypothetical protein LBQ59_00995 [Candidatus Peribacteria bacterium]|jgi:hypothetical protein|nr:hypothetical protein [Candidatus Peribacteria bacterium]